MTDSRIEGPFSGGCQCGAVRYRLDYMLDTAHICHCRMCQKASGNYFAALAATDNAALHWTRGAPALFASSDPVERGFCNQCGTPLTYRYRPGGHTAVMLGSLDDPARLQPNMQFGIEARMPWFADLSGLRDDGPTEVTMADAAPLIRASNHQHPDHDTPAWPVAKE